MRKDAGSCLSQAVFAPPDFGGAPPPDASKNRQTMRSGGGGGFPQGFAAFGCIGSSASGCQPAEESNIYLRVPGFTISAQTPAPKLLPWTSSWSAQQSERGVEDIRILRSPSSLCSSLAGSCDGEILTSW